MAVPCPAQPRHIHTPGPAPPCLQRDSVTLAGEDGGCGPARLGSQAKHGSAAALSTLLPGAAILNIRIHWNKLQLNTFNIQI